MKLIATVGGAALIPPTLAAATVTDRDPVFAAIEAYEIAEKESAAAAAAHDEAESACHEAYPEPRVQIGVSRPATLILDGEEHFVESKLVFTSAHAEIDRELNKRLRRYLGDASTSRLLERQRRALHRELQRMEDARTNPEVRRLQKIAFVAGKREVDAADALQRATERPHKLRRGPVWAAAPST